MLSSVCVWSRNLLSQIHRIASCAAGIPPHPNVVTSPTHSQTIHQQTTGSPRHLPKLGRAHSLSPALWRDLAGQGRFKAGSDSGLEEAASFHLSHSKSPGAGLERLAKPQQLLYNIHPSLFSRKISKATTLAFLGQEIHSQDQQFL